MKVSVVVANNGRDLTKLGHSLLNSSYQDVELIVVDEGKERSYQRNKGIKQAKGEIVIWLDSDQSVSPNMILDCVHQIGLGATAVYIPEVIIADSFFGKVRKFEREFYTGTPIDVPRAVVRAACPMFNEDLNGPEDADWGNRIQGLKVVGKNVLYHHDDIGLLDYLEKKAYYSKSMKKYQALWPDDKCLNWKWRCFGVFVERGKWRKLIRHPLLAACIFGLIFLRGIVYVANR